MARGVSLVELLVAMLMVTIVAGAAMVVFRTTAEHEVRQQDNIDQIESLRAAFFTVGRDIRMAGNGLGLLGTTGIYVFVPEELFNEDAQDPPAAGQRAGWFKPRGAAAFGALALSGTDSDADDPTQGDTLTIFRADAEAINNFASLSDVFSPGDSTTLELNRDVTEGVDLADGDIIALSYGTVTMILQARLDPDSVTTTLSVGDRYAPEAALPTGTVFPSGTSVYNLKNVSFVTYFLDTANLQLMANYHDRTADPADPDRLVPNIAVIANNIEDFQVQCSYFPFTTPQPTFGPCAVPADGTTVNAVQLGMVSRAQSRFSNDKEVGEPLELMGHTADAESGFTRRILVEYIQLRNFGPE